MTVGQIFENAPGRKTVWSKRGDKLSKREISTVAAIRPRTKIETVKESKQ